MFRVGLAFYENTNGIAKVITAGMLLCGITLVVVNLLK